MENCISTPKKDISSLIWTEKRNRMTEGTLSEVMAFFKTEDTTAQKFREEWLALSDEDKKELKAGIHDGSLTYDVNGELKGKS